ncbi:MAG: CoA transferase [Candidatus Lambdaproteobacteria bacterium]|nr:CoA transferase [Candidatus Lambdaproteobacteria bacterium]
MLDSTHIVAGPFCVSILADYGAEVIKVEPPGPGELGRRLGTPVQGPEGQVGFTPTYAVTARSRRGVALDLRSEAGKGVFRELAKVSDVIVENFAPGAMERLGLSYNHLKPLNSRLVYAAISGYGQLEPYIGPYAQWPSNNAIAQAMGGLMEQTGEANGPPIMVGATIGDTLPGLWAALAVMAALHQRSATGQGQFLDIAMYDCMAAMSYQAVASYDVTKEERGRGREGWGITFTDRVPCRDGYIAVSMWGHDAGRWVKFWRLIGREDLVGPSLDDPIRPGGRGDVAVLRAALERWLADVTKTEAVRVLLELGFSAGMLQTPKELYECPQLAARDLFVDVGDGLGGTMRTFRMPVKSSAFRPPKPTPPPHVGEHTREVLTTVLGYADAQFEALGKAGAFGRSILSGT